MCAAAVVLLPSVLRVDYVIKASAVIAFAIIGMSLVVLTGWAGQISLGQMAIVGIGAAVSATVHLAMERRPDARSADRWARRCRCRVRRRRACAAAARPVPGGHDVRTGAGHRVVAAERPLLRLVPERPKRVSSVHRCSARSASTRQLATTRTRCRVGASSTWRLRGIRRSRTGRVIIAVRENERAAQSFSVDVVRAKLTAFVVSGVRGRVGWRAVRPSQPVVQRHAATAPARASTCSRRR